MQVRQNTLYVVTRKAVVSRDHLTLKVSVEKETKLVVPIHQLEAVAVFGGVHVTAWAMSLCVEHGVSVHFLSESGRLLSRVDAPGSGNVLLRREQFRQADRPERCRDVAAAMVAGKVHNCRNLLLRSARESTDAAEVRQVRLAIDRLADALPNLGAAGDVDSVRGYEGDAARVYFEVFPYLVRADRVHFQPKGRSRRPPLDRMNALLSFLYSLLTADCCSALSVAGLDPSVGFLHVDRPGRPSLALDLMEEFRPWLVDRLALTLVNRQQVKADGFEVRDGGAVWMTEATRKVVLGAWQQKKKEEMVHPILEEKIAVGRVPFVQARILARHLRGDLETYLPCIPKS